MACAGRAALHSETHMQQLMRISDIIKHLLRGVGCHRWLFVPGLDTPTLRQLSKGDAVCNIGPMGSMRLACSPGYVVEGCCQGVSLVGRAVWCQSQGHVCLRVSGAPKPAVKHA